MRSRFLLIRIVAVALLLYSLYSLFNSYSGIEYAGQAAAGMERSLEMLEAENSELRAKLASAESGELLEKLARKRLGYVMPGERVFCFFDEIDG